MKKVYISGMSGFIGSHLSSFLKAKGFDVRALSRNDFMLDDVDFQNKIQDADIVINLAGAPINNRWSEKYKKELLNSRILPTAKIAQAVISNKHKPELFISNSAIGIYDDTGMQNEDSEINATDFLKKLCIQWEEEAFKAAPYTDVTICRLGVVLSKDGGALKKMLTPFKFGLGGKIGNGKQAFSWIHMEDLLNAYFFIIDKHLTGIFNLTAPQPINNESFTKTLSKTINRSAFLPIPAFALNLLHGEGSIVLIKGQHVVPKNLICKSFKFKFNDIESALNDLV